MTEKLNPIFMTIASPLPTVGYWVQTTSYILDLLIKFSSLVAGVCIALWWINKLWDKAPELIKRFKSIFHRKQ